MDSVPSTPRDEPRKGSGQPGPEPGPGHHRARPERLSTTGERVFQCLSLGLVVFDRQMEIVQHNAASEFLVAGHRSIAEALNAATMEATYQDWIKTLHEVINLGRQQRFDQVVYRDDRGGERLLCLQCYPLPDPSDGQVTGGILVIEDVTLAAGLEKRLAVSERMAAVGKLAAKVAHELNNPLDGILRYLSLAQRAHESGTGEKVADYLVRARTGLLRMTEIVRELVEFSRAGHTAFDDASLNAIVEEAVKVMADKATQARVSIVCTLQERIPAVRGSNMFQVFCNLIKNAIDAMPDGGTLTISTRTTEREVLIRFEDTGIGLPEEINRLFEPFFTTKPAGKGTGLGLAVCKDIMEKYNGKIVPERRPEGGTAFTIRLPIESCSPMREGKRG